MNSKRTIQTKRTGKRYNSVWKKQKASAAATQKKVGQGSTSAGAQKVTKALLILLGLHLAAVAVIFIQSKLTEGKVEYSKAIQTKSSGSLEIIKTEKIGKGEQYTFVDNGDTYAVIADRVGVTEKELRKKNKNKALQVGMTLRVPERKIEVLESDEVKTLRANRSNPHQATEVEVKLVKPNVHVVTQKKSKTVAPAQPTSYATHTVSSGETLYKIARAHGSNVKAIMQANGITDGNKISIGMKLRVPKN